MQRCCKESIIAISQRRRVFRGGDSFAVRSHSTFTCVEDDKAPSVGHRASECTLITFERVGAWTAPLRWPLTPSFSAANASLPRISSSTRVYGQGARSPRLDLLRDRMVPTTWFGVEELVLATGTGMSRAEEREKVDWRSKEDSKSHDLRSTFTAYALKLKLEL